MRKADFLCEIWYNIVNLFVNWGKLFRKQERKVKFHFNEILQGKHARQKCYQCKFS